MIAVIDCQMGNVRAFLNIYKRLNIPAIAATRPEQVEAADHLILPGVGAFDWAMERFNSSGLRDVVEHVVVERKTPLLGICIGMHMLACASDEGKFPGLGWIPGEVKKFTGNNDLPLPHMGWNDVSPSGVHKLFAGMEDEAHFYFLHSYYFEPDNRKAILSQTEYGAPFASSVAKENIHGVQFHPEKSHGFGIRLLQNFAEI